MRHGPLHPALEYGRFTGEADDLRSTSRGHGPEGFFRLSGPEGRTLIVIASDGRDWFEPKKIGDNEDLVLSPPAWEHVSVHALGHDKRPRTPSWKEMCWIKDLFWDEEELVVQFHPPKSAYVNVHDNTLHLWAVIGATIPMPPRICV